MKDRPCQQHAWQASGGSQKLPERREQGQLGATPQAAHTSIAKLRPTRVLASSIATATKCRKVVCSAALAAQCGKVACTHFSQWYWSLMQLYLQRLGITRRTRSYPFRLLHRSSSPHLHAGVEQR